MMTMKTTVIHDLDVVAMMLMLDYETKEIYQQLMPSLSSSSSLLQDYVNNVVDHSVIEIVIAEPFEHFDDSCVWRKTTTLDCRDCHRNRLCFHRQTASRRL
jgi:hypothetical protein